MWWCYLATGDHAPCGDKKGEDRDEAVYFNATAEPTEGDQVQLQCFGAGRTNFALRLGLQHRFCDCFKVLVWTMMISFSCTEKKPSTARCDWN